MSHKRSKMFNPLHKYRAFRLQGNQNNSEDYIHRTLDNLNQIINQDK